MKPALPRLGLVALFLAVSGLFTGGVWWFGYTSATLQEAEQGVSDLALASDRLTGQLQRYREMAVFLADHPQVDASLGGVTGRTEEMLLSMMDRTGSLGIAVIGRDGREVAAAEGAAGVNHTGQPYFERAMDGAIGVYHTVSGRYPGPFGERRRAFIFAAPVFSPEGPVMGTVLVAANIDAIEAEWRGDRPDVFFTDAGGVVFVSNRSELLYMVQGDAENGDADYPPGLLRPFVGYEAGEVGGLEVWTLDGGRYLPARALHLTLDLPTVDLTGEALIDLAPARRLAGLQASVAAAVCLVFGALLYLATLRRRTLAIANERLEGRVARRTRALQDLNADLRREVAERTAAEQRLKVAQAELVQAGKLSALGQMSAGISHELNQPLMAIQSFSENAEAFLDRGQPEKARANLTRISELGNRMGRIIRNLRAFARQESTDPKEVNLAQVVEAALEISAARARQAGAEITWTPPGHQVRVLAGDVRLQQVLLNLIGNAIDAMSDSEEKRVDIAIETSGPRVRLSVRDTGPGIAEPDRIFDPFYSTKAVGAGEGMGLGLSISYGLVQSFGGAIRGRNHEGGGAVFEIELEPAPKAEAA